MTPIAPENFSLLDLVLTVLLGVQLPLVGFVAMGTVVAVLLEIYIGDSGDGAHRTLADDLFARTLQGQARVGFLLLALVAVTLACAAVIYPETGLGALFALGVLLQLAGGLALLQVRARLAGKPHTPQWLVAAAGLAGAGGLLAAMFVFFCGLAFLLRPDLWPHVGRLPWLILSWNGVARFLEFLVLSLGFTGAVVLLCGRSRAGADPVPDDCRRLASRTGGILALVALLGWPPLQLWSLYTFSAQVRSAGLFVLAVATLGVALVLALVFVSLLEKASLAAAKPVFVGFLLLFFAGVATGHLTRENHLNAQTLPEGKARFEAFYPRPAAAEEPATAPEESATAPEKSATAPEKSAAAPAEPVAAPQEPSAPSPADDEAVVRGKAVFERVCAGCHAFDQRVVGPPLNSVLEAYRGDLAALKEFIRNPVKKNPDYPPMPKLGLPEDEIDSVARYLLQQGGG